MITTSRLAKRYGERQALDGVTFTLAPGEVAALLGANGAGKTTLLKCLLGLLRFEGEARVGGLDVARHGKAVRRLTGYLPQTSAFPAHLTVAETLAHYADLRGLRDEDIDARLDAVGLTDYADTLVAALSGGLRQRLGITVALLGDPPVLILDEPLASLDPEGQALLRDLIRRLKADGRAVLLSTHVFEMLDGVAERALALVDGRLAYDGPLTGLMQESAPTRRVVLPAPASLAPGTVPAERTVSARPVEAVAARLVTDEVMS